MTEKLPSEPIFRLLAIMSRLRSPNGCPWDRAQTPESLKPYLLEEAYEVLDAIDNGETGNIKEELGDLLLQVVFLAEIFQSRGEFDFASVCEAISRKLIRRHPHVFGDSNEKNIAQLDRQWDSIKRSESASEPDSLVAGIPRNLPALLQAQKISARAARAGFDWNSPAEVMNKLDEEIDELKKAMESNDKKSISREIGDILFTVVNIGRHLEVDCETSLLDMIRRFETRFREMENLILENGKIIETMDIENMEPYWQQAKQENSEKE